MRLLRIPEVEELQHMPTLCQGQCADLKMDDGRFRVWLSRMGPEDGETHPVQVEELRDGRWEDITDELSQH